MKKRALSWLLALTMLLSLAPQTLPVWASATGETATESKLSANTYSALGLNRSSVDTSSLPKGEQPYGKAEEGNTVATNVINELYVNFNGSIHYGWSILDNLTMQWTDSSNWTSSANFAGAMGYWRPGQQTVHYGSGSAETGALFAANGTAGTHQGHIISDNINSANKHLVYQYSKSEAFSPNTGKDNYVAELVLDSNNWVSLYIYQVEGGNKRYVRSASVVQDEFAGDKNTVIWNWEYDAMYDIAAGDMDGDGYDEIAVYASNYVYLYKYNGTTLEQIDKRPTASPSNNYWQTRDDRKYKKLGTAVVTLAFGDLNQDNKEELVVAQNMGYGANNIDSGDVGIYTLSKNGLTSSQDKEHFSLYYGEESGNRITIRYANVATGDIDGDYKDELIIAGYYSGSDPEATCTTGAVYYKVVKWNGTTYNDSGWKSTTFTKSDLLGRVVNNEEQLIPPVSLTCAATQGVGYAEQVFLSGCLYSVDSSNNLTLLTQISTNREYKKDNGDKANKEEIFVVNVVAGNFNGNRNGQEQIVYAFGMKHDNSDRYWYDIGYINKKNATDVNATSSSEYWYGQEQVMNYESSYNRDSSKSRASLYLSLAAVDCDNDSTLVRYKGQEITWTKPEVLTVLQSAPYFQDLQDTRDYLDQAQTGYGKGKGESEIVTAGGSLKLGTYVSFEQDFSVFGVKIASIQAEAQSTHSFEYGFEEVEKTEVTINYSGSAGDDYVVVYAVPYVEYQYETWVPGYHIPESDSEYQQWKTDYVGSYLKGKIDNWDALGSERQQAEIDAVVKEFGLTQGKDVEGSWQPSTVSVPMTPQTVLLSVDAYDEIAEQTEGLEPIRGNILNSTPGEPSTYDSFGARTDFHQIGADQMVTTAEGSNTSVGGTTTNEQTHTFNYSYEFEAKAGIGAGGVTVGILAGFEANAGGGVGTSSSKSYTATVDNLPSDASGYSFSWRFGTREATLNGNPVLILEYQLADVLQPPSAPRNLRVEEVTSSSVTLGWDAVPGAGSYEVYQISTTGKKYLRETVPGTATSYTDTNVTPNTGYTYCIKNVAKSGASSIYSTQVQASTLTDSDGKFVIEQQPGNDNIVSTYVGGTATATVQAKYLDEEGQEKTLWYYWEKYDTETKTWDDYQSGKNPTLTISDVTEDMDGDKYRCQVFYASNLYLYTEPVTLKIGKANSTTTLSSAQANQTVNASYVKTEEVETEETKTVPVKKTVGGAEYTEYKADSITVYLGGDGTYYSITGKTATPLSQESKNVQLTYTIAEALKTISFGELTQTTFDGTTSPVTYEYQDEGSTTEKTTYTANQKYTYGGDSSVEVYNCHTDANDSAPASDFWFVKIGDGKYAADVETAIQLNINDSTHVDVNDLVQSTTKEKITKIQQTTVSGAEVNLTATVNDANTQDAGPTGKVVFKIVNSVGDGSGTVTGTITNGVATATWKPSVAGVYTITAAYEGSEKHMGSASAGSITINVVVPGEKKLVIDSPNSMTYGDAAIHLKAMLLSGAEGKTTDVTSNVTYSVNDEELAGTSFNPTAAGTYTIKATYTNAGETLTATKTINVGKRTVKIVPKVENNKTDYTIENLVSTDENLFSGRVTVTCDGADADAEAGEYPINVTYTPGDNETAINSKYLVLVDTTQVYTVSDDVVTVTNATNSNNGTVTLQYIVGGVAYTVGSDGTVPKGAKLVAYATPKKGYQVEKWTINNDDVYLNGTSGAYNTAQIYTVTDDVQEDYTVKAEFKPTYYMLNFNVQGDSGTVTANYWNGTTAGSSFTSGGRLSPLDSVQLTANVPGKSITGWQITQNGTDKIVDVDGTAYTGTSYILTSISADTTVTVLTEEQKACTVTVSLVDADGKPLVNEQATVSFSPEGTKETSAANGVFTYNGYTHDNLTVTLTLPDGLIVDEWVDSEGKALTEGNLSSDKKTWSISNLSKDFAWKVKCSTPNSFRVTTNTQLNGTTDTEAGTISVYKVGQSEEVTSGGTVLQASSLRVVITTNPVYQLWSVTCNEKAKGVTSDFTINGVNEDINIVANFVKKPVVTITKPTNGEVTASGMEISNSTVAYGDTRPITFTAIPDTGYEVDTWTVKVGDAESTSLTSDQVTKDENSDNQTYTYTPGEDGITSNVTVTVTFKALPKATVNFSVVDKNGAETGGLDGNLQAVVTRYGTTTPYDSGTITDVYRDSVVTFVATPDSGYAVSKWLVDGHEQTTQPILKIGADDNGTTKTVKVQFEKISEEIKYGITADSDADHGGTLNVTFLAQGGSTPADTIQNGTVVKTEGTLTAEVTGLNDGYEIESWTLNGAPYEATDGKLTCDVSENQGADIRVKIVRKSYQINFSATAGGTITATANENALQNPATVKGDTNIAFTASEPATGYEFIGWKVDGQMIQETARSYTLKVTKDTTVQACYAMTQTQYTVTYGIIQTSGQDNGTLSVSGLNNQGKANAGSTITFTAAPAEGYQVKQWYSAATDGTEIGTAESGTYQIENLTEDTGVYVRFEPIPSYHITVDVTGQGSVTATVNGEAATISGNQLTVKRHDKVVLTASPASSQYLTSWTLDDVSQGNGSLTLTLSDVTDNHTVAANFDASQGVPFKTICGTDGTLEAKAGYGDALTTIDAASGISVDKGKKIVLTVTPPAGQAVMWTVNGKPTDELSNTYTIDAINAATTVEAKFETLKLWTIPTETVAANYTISDVTKTPEDYGGNGQIREKGTVSFKVTPKNAMLGLQGLPENAKVVQSADGSYTVTIENVTDNVAFQMTEYQAVPGELKIPSGSDYKTVEELKSALRTQISSSVSGSNIKYLDIKLQINTGNGWEDVTAANFPKGGINITIEYDTLGSGLDKSYNYSVAHMLASGTVENLPVTNGESGITFHVNSLSPFAIGWYKANGNTGGGGGGGGGGVVSTYTLTFDTNGGSAMDKITKDSGTTIDLAAYKPTRAGYTFAGWFSDKELTKAVTSVKLTANTTVYAKWTQDGGTVQNPFVDVKEGAYYYDAVLWAVDQKITSGTSATTFSPDASCTRAQMVTFLWRAAGSPKAGNTKNPFTDVKADAYYYDAVLWAVEKGVTSGTSATTFSPDATVTRGQTVTFLYRNAGSPDVTGTMPFTDVEADAYYAKAVLWAVQQKITTGTSETTFSPTNDCTRGQIVTFLYRAK